MSYPTSRADRYRRLAEELSHLAEGASSDFIRRYYQRTAERCLLVAEGEEAPLPKWLTAGARSDSSAPLSDEVITTVPQAMPQLDEAIASVPRSGDHASSGQGHSVSRQIGSTAAEQDRTETGHGRGAAHIVRELARRISRLTSRTMD
jgi:hypothetical protein